MKQSKGKTILTWIAQVLLALLFVAAALGKLASNPQWVERFRDYGYTDTFRLLIGSLEVAGALGLLIPRTAGYAALGLLGIMVGASVTHLTHHEAAQLWRPIVFGVLLVVVVLIRRPWPLRSKPQPAESVAAGQPS